MKNVKTGHTRPIVCLDAGHYGKSNRSPAVLEYYESEMNWKLHLLLKSELEAFGIEVKQTRSDPAKDLGLTARGKASANCDLFISIHSNAVGSSGTDENTDYPVVIVMQDGKGDVLGEQLAECVEALMGTRQDGRIYKKRGTYGGEWYSVLAGAAAVGTMGMIIEHSFHTNTKATKWLMDDTNLARMAKAEAEIIADWFGMAKAEKPAQSGSSAATPNEPDHIYRVRKSWGDASSQIGAYRNLDYAKTACTDGYTVYDWNGDPVYSKEADKLVLDPARSYNKAKAGTYKVNSSDGVLNLRTGAAVSKRLIEAMPTGSKVVCYGYYTGDWLFVVSESGKTGFCHGGYLIRV